LAALASCRIYLVGCFSITIKQYDWLAKPND
jgi:hypothetical protein